MKFSTFIIPTFVLFVCSLSKAQDVQASPEATIAAANKRPSILQNVGIDQKLGASIPLNLVFNDEHGNTVQLKDYFGTRPVILILVYYQCPMLCTMVMNDVLRALRSMPETVGKDFDILTVSFDPRDKPSDALRKKETYLAQYNRPGSAAGWHFLTGEQPSIDSLTQAVGFRYAWDPKFQMFAHASGIMIVTPDGKLSRYFFGIDYAPKDVRIALTESASGKVGGLADAVLLYCFCYDPATGKYGLTISHLLKLGGILTLMAVTGFVVTSLWRERRTSKPG
jgi:protein SCO1/2